MLHAPWQKQPSSGSFSVPDCVFSFLISTSSERTAALFGCCWGSFPFPLFFAALDGRVGGGDGLILSEGSDEFDQGVRWPLIAAKIFFVNLVVVPAFSKQSGIT